MNRGSPLLRLNWLRHRRDFPKYGKPCVVTHHLVPPMINVRSQATSAVEESYVKKFMKAVGWMDQSRTMLKLTGYFLYESIPSQVDYVEWFRLCELDDSFASWFNVTELHVWILMVRCMAEDFSTSQNIDKYVKGDGYFIRNCIVEGLWADVGNRIKLLEGANPSVARRQVAELSEQFQAALVGYDEGLADDRVLAAAVWRRLLAGGPRADPEAVARVVHFVRHQISVLDRIPSEQFRQRPNEAGHKIEWLKLANH